MAKIETPPELSERSGGPLTAFFKSPVLRNRTLLALSLAAFIDYIGVGMVGPVRVLFAQSQGASLAIIGAMASAYLISNFLFQYPLGWLADRWGRRQVMIVGLLLQAVLSALYLVVADPVLFVALRFLEGIAAASLLPAARALIIDTIPVEQQGEAFGLFSAFFNAGFLFGPGLGGLLAATGYASAFIGAVVFRLVATGVVLGMIRSGGSYSKTKLVQRKPKVSYKSFFTLPLLGAYIIAFGDYLYLGFDLSLMPLWMHDHLGGSVELIGFAYMAWAVPNMLLSPLGGRVADRRNRSWLLLICGLAQVPLYLAYGFLNIAVFVAVLFAVHGAIYAFMQPTIDAHVAAASADGVRARVQSLYTSVGLVGAFISSTGLGPIYALNFRLPLFLIGLAYALCVLIGVGLIRLAERRAKHAG